MSALGDPLSLPYVISAADHREPQTRCSLVLVRRRRHIAIQNLALPGPMGALSRRVSPQCEIRQRHAGLCTPPPAKQDGHWQSDWPDRHARRGLRRAAWAGGGHSNWMAHPPEQPPGRSLALEVPT
jgi:hypothetical protein